jgi:hypothetical protein
MHGPLSSVLRFLFRWSQNTALGTVVRKSDDLFPITEVIHLFGLTLLLGTVIAMNLRLLGFGASARLDAAQGQGEARIFWPAFGVTVVTGTVLFLAEPLKCYNNAAFLAKMALLLVALLFHVTLHRWIRRSADIPAAAGRAVAVLSLALWFAVGVAGRFIGFI